MKRILLSAIALLMCTITYAQETVKRSNDITEQLTEKFSVLKSDKKIRQGEYTATYKGVEVAKGAYQNNKRTGTWNFFNATGKLIQVFNYDENKLILVDKPDTSLKYHYADNVTKADTVSPPVKIGGFYYSLMPMLFHFELGRIIHNNNPGISKATCTHIITINTKGDVIKHQVMVTVNGANQLYVVDDSKFDADMLKFTPAMVNHQPIEAKLTTTTVMTF
jgi:antitoxin component YwqK of YwqJK toxin-antitoxin module